MIDKVTLKGYLENLTSGQGHDLIRKGHVTYQRPEHIYGMWMWTIWIRIVGLNTSMVFLSL